MPRREFKLIDSYGYTVGSYTGSNPHQAALKAASKGHHDIALREHYGDRQYASKVHVYQGGVRKLCSSEKSAWAEAMGMKHKPVVSKKGTFAL